ncbi:MAG: FeoA family protein [Blastocatellia bacterium]
MTLRELPVGEDAKVIAVHGSSAVSRRLMEMGVVPGVSIKMIKAAPFGDPVEIRLLGYNLAIRKREAAAVEVEA